MQRMQQCFIYCAGIFCSIGLFFAKCAYATALCQGHFINPITDICWECLLPITIGASAVANSSYPDTPNPTSPVGYCPAPPPVFWRLGLNVGYWEPFSLTDVTRVPYCMVNLGGLQLNLGSKAGIGGTQMRSNDSSESFYYVHWYKYPVIYWLQLLTSLGCLQGGEFDIAYLTELDPTWNDSELAYILNPEAMVFGRMRTQTACSADVGASLYGTAVDPLFWCAGAQGSMYPLTGWVQDEHSPVQAATLLTERMDFKMHREGLVMDTVGENSPANCFEYPMPIMPKSRYRYEMTNVVPDANSCHPFGQLDAFWEYGHHYPGEGNQFGYLVWEKRNCVYL